VRMAGEDLFDQCGSGTRHAKNEYGNVGQNPVVHSRVPG
jgi:hypothetical protein